MHVLVPAAVPGEAVRHQHEVVVLVRVWAGARGLPSDRRSRLLLRLLRLTGLHPGLALLGVAGPGGGGSDQPLSGGGGGGQHAGGVTPSLARPRHSHALGWL